MYHIYMHTTYIEIWVYDFFQSKLPRNNKKVCILNVLYWKKILVY